MTTFKIIFEDTPYFIHVVNASNYKHYISILPTICDYTFISKSFENLSYSSLEYNNYIGFFLTDSKNTKLFVSLIIDLECGKNKNLLRQQEIPLDESMEITLLCSNKNTHVAGLTRYFVKHVITFMLKQYKPSTKYLFLYVAGGSSNTRAMNFYQQIGFQLVDTNVMMYEYQVGGRKQLKRTKRNKRKRIKRKITKRTKRTKKN